MTTLDQPTEPQRESFLDVARREMIAFENKEREFRRRAKQDDLAKLRLPGGSPDLH